MQMTDDKKISAKGILNDKIQNYVTMLHRKLMIWKHLDINQETIVLMQENYLFNLKKQPAYNVKLVRYTKVGIL